MSRHIVFLLPYADNRSPAGGFKVVYEYANRLVADGERVTIVYPAYADGRADFSFRMSGLRTRWKQHVRLLHVWLRRLHCPDWFAVHREVSQRMVWSLESTRLPKADIYIATAVQTATTLLKRDEIPPESKYYFIQSFEDWSGLTRAEVEATWRYPFKKIVISPWLQSIAQELQVEAALVKNGFDFDYFRCTESPQERDPLIIAAMYHTLELKGWRETAEALTLIRERKPSLRCLVFGAFPRGDDVPAWMEYFQSPDRETHNHIYNTAAIYVAASHREGWGLTVGEAMQCGCAVACTDNAGFAAMAIHDETALVSPVRDAPGLAEHILRLIEDDALRQRLANAGHEFIKQFSWETSYCRLREALSLAGISQCH